MVARMDAAVVEVTIDDAQLEAFAGDDAAGAVVTFRGVVRNHDDGRAVAGIRYVGHPSADAVMRRTVAEFQDRDGVHAVAAHHRVGDLAIGDAALVVVVGASHRKQAFACASDLVDRIKEALPIWKLQRFTDGSEEWSQCP